MGNLVDYVKSQFYLYSVETQPNESAYRLELQFGPAKAAMFAMTKDLALSTLVRWGEPDALALARKFNTPRTRWLLRVAEAGLSREVAVGRTWTP